MKKKIVCICLVIALITAACCMTACGDSTVKSLSLRGRTQYIVGEEFEGATLTVTYENGKRDQIPVTEEMLSGFDTTVAGNKTVIVSYKGKTVEFAVTVSEFYASSIAVSGDSVKEYKINSSYTDGDAFIVVTYTDGSTRTQSVTADMLSGFDTSATGKKQVTVSYDDLKTVYEISVRDLLVTSLTPASSLRTDYRVGDLFGGADFVAEYEDGTIETVTVRDVSSVIGFDTSAVGKKTVRVAYKNSFADFEINVLKAVSDIVIVGYDDVYGVGDPFGSANIKLVYADGTEETLPVSEDMVETFDTSVGGKHTVKLNFEGRKQLSYEILVVGKLQTAEYDAEKNYYKLQAEDEDYSDMSEAELQSGATNKFENVTQQAVTNTEYPNGADGYSTCNISVIGNKITVRFISEKEGKFRFGVRAQSGSGSGRQDTDISKAWSASVNGTDVAINGTLKAACAGSTNWKDMTVWTELTDITGELTLVKGVNTVELTFLQPTMSTIRFPNVDYFIVTVQS